MPQNPASDSLTERIRARLPEFIGEKRLNHTFFVEKEVVALAESLDMVYNISDAQKNDLRAAALLHDITKEMPLEKQLELCGKYGIDAGKYPSCAVLHGAHGRLPRPRAVRDLPKRPHFLRRVQSHDRERSDERL